MARHTRQPEVLRELFEALGNDPFVIAECLARPLLAERLLTQSASEQVKQISLSDEQVIAAAGDYSLPSISGDGACTDDTWTPTNTSDAPSGRNGHTVVWTGTEMIVWGGYGGSYFNTGGRYDPSTDSWAAISTTSAPTGRSGHTAVWTGTEMIIWGGYGDGTLLNTGGRYNPATDIWTDTDISSAPSARDDHTAIWTGSEMIIWGGANAIYFPPEALGSGARYNPVTNSWTGMSGYSERFRHTAVWTGTEMIVWGGANFDFRGLPVALGDGGKYNPSTDSWTATGSTNAPASRQWHTAVWTGSEMIVWGGRGDASNDFNIGGRFHPSTDSWTATSTTNAPTARSLHTAVWTGSEMIVWGGDDFPNFFRTGGRYNPDTDTWTATSLTHAPVCETITRRSGPAVK